MWFRVNSQSAETRWGGVAETVGGLGEKSALSLPAASTLENFLHEAIRLAAITIHTDQITYYKPQDQASKGQQASSMVKGLCFYQTAITQRDLQELLELSALLMGTLAGYSPSRLWDLNQWPFGYSPNRS